VGELGPAGRIDKGGGCRAGDVVDDRDPGYRPTRALRVALADTVNDRDVQLFEAIALRTPTRKALCCSRYTTDCTFGLSTTVSMMTSRASGNRSATVSTAAH